MKDLIFSITLNNHTFITHSNHIITRCEYYIEDKYTAYLLFASKTFARVEYKNVMFSGTVTKRDNWNIYLDLRNVVEKHYGRYYFPKASDPTQVHTKTKSYDKATIEYPKNFLYTELINNFSELYSYINDKETFKAQLCEYLSDSYDLTNIEQLDDIIEYENFADVEPEEEPIIENYTERNRLYKECENLFISFIQSETDNKNKKVIITLENVVKETPELRDIPHKLLFDEFNTYVSENYNDLITPDIYYCQSDELHRIGIHIYKACQYHMFINSMRAVIKEILATTDVDINEDEIYYRFNSLYSKENIPSKEEFKQSVKDFISDYISFCHLYNKFFSLFNSDRIDLEWDDKQIRLFEEYDKKTLPIDSHHIAEYEVYKYIIPFYRKHLFQKNSTKYKPTIEQMPAFVSYASSVLDILFKHNVFLDNEDCVIYNENGDIDSAREEIEKVSIR